MKPHDFGPLKQVAVGLFQSHMTLLIAAVGGWIILWRRRPGGFHGIEVEVGISMTLGLVGLVFGSIHLQRLRRLARIEAASAKAES